MILEGLIKSLFQAGTFAKSTTIRHEDPNIIHLSFVIFCFHSLLR